MKRLGLRASVSGGCREHSMIGASTTNKLVSLVTSGRASIGLWIARISGKDYMRHSILHQGPSQVCREDLGRIANHRTRHYR